MATSSSAADQPTISVVTPSFNQAIFLGDTIESVLGQSYPHVEYMIMDGGSVDQSVEIIRAHESRLAFWRSHQDAGQAAAINEGLGRATGSILAWLNSDDCLLPGALQKAHQLLEPAKPQVLLGNSIWLEEAACRAKSSDVQTMHRKMDLAWVDYVLQPSTFWTRRAWELVGPLDDSLHYVFDWDWFLRARKLGVEFLTTSQVLALYRIHPAHKSGSGSERRHEEIRSLYRREGGERAVRLLDWICEHRSFLSRFSREMHRARLAPHRTRLVEAMFRGRGWKYTPRELESALSVVFGEW